MKKKMEAPLNGKASFGGFNLQYDSTLTHFAYVGATGSGKTISQRFLYQSAITPYIGLMSRKGGEGIRALMYDAKGDLLSILLGIGEDLAKKRYQDTKSKENAQNYYLDYAHSIITLNPFDTRSYAWHIAKDVQDEATALEIANILIPEREESQPFFRQAARDILSGVMTAYVYEKPLEWTLRDVLFPLLHEDIQILENVLKMSDFSRDRLQYFEHKDTIKSIRSTIRTELKPLQLIASLWYRASKEKTISGGQRVFSLDDWVKSPVGQVLILGNSYKLRESLKRINQIIFKRASQLLLDLSELEKGESRKTFVCLDELAQLGKLDGLTDLLTNGRSKGVSLVIGFQDFDSLKDTYGEDTSNVIFGQCASKAIFRVGSGSSAKWASEQFGDKERFDKTKSEGESYNWESGTTTSSDESEKIEKREAVLTQEFLTIPMTTPKNGLTGFYFSPYIKDLFQSTSFIKRTISSNDISKYLCKKANKSNDFENNKRPSNEQKMEDWDDQEFVKFLGVPYSTEPIGEPKEISEEDALDNWNQNL